MKKVLNKLYRKFPFIDSIISLLFGAIISYLFQWLVDIWRGNGTANEKVVICTIFLLTLAIMSVYYKFFYSFTRKTSSLEKEREKNEIRRLRSERELIISLYKQGTRAIENSDLSITEKAKIVKQINLVINENKRSE